MKEKTFALYRSFIGCLLLSSLFACTSIAPYQQISEAKQALSGVLSLSENEQLNDIEMISLQSAQQKLYQAEQMMSNQQYDQAGFLSEESKRLSQNILKTHQKTIRSNVKFRY